MADLITWKTVTAPSVAAELAEARKAQEGIGTAFDSLGGRVEDYAADKQKRTTDAFIADLNLAANEEERNAMIEDARTASGWLNMQRVTDASQAATKFDMAKELHTDQMGTNRAEREHMKAEDEYNKAMLDAKTKSNKFDRENAEKVAQKTLDFRKEKILLDKTVADKQKAAAEQALTTANEEAAFNALKRKEWEGRKDVRLGATQAELRAQEKATRDAANLKIFNEAESVIADLPAGSKESIAAIKALRDQVTGVGGMDLTTFNNKIRRYREANLAASVGFGDESYQKILDYNFVPNPVNELGQPLDRPPLAAFTSYEAMLRRVLTNDPKNKGISKAAIEAKLNQILNTPEYVTGKRAATQIQASIDKVEDVRELTQSKIAQANEDFHVEVKNSTAANHIIALLYKNFPQNYSKKVIKEDELRDKIQTTLDKVNKLYGATTPKVKSAYARAVYKLFSMSQAEWSGPLLEPDIIGVPGTQGEFWGKTSARTMGWVDFSLEKLSDNRMSQVLSPHLLTRHQDTVDAKKKVAEKALSGKKEKKTEDQILLDKLKLPVQEHQINRYLRTQNKQVR